MSNQHILIGIRSAVEAKFKKVAVLMGGISSERDVSLRSGVAIVQGLTDAGCDVTGIVLDRESIDGLIPDGTEAVFVALHGGYGENGGVQSDLNRLGIPYTGPGAKACAIAIDKVATKKEFIRAGIPTPAYKLIEPSDNDSGLPFPLAVKPPCDGSSFGLTCPCYEQDWLHALEIARKIDPQVLVEEYISGREWTVAVVAGEALPIIEITPNGGVYDFASKYTKGATEYKALDDNATTVKCKELALRACDVIGARGLSRVDFRVTDNGDCLALEVNTVPGFTATSLVPKAAAKAGMSFSEVCVKILNLAQIDC